MKFPIIAAMAFFSPTQVNSQIDIANSIQQYVVDCGQTREAKKLVKSLQIHAFAKERQNVKNLRKSGICVLHLTPDQAQELKGSRGIDFVEADQTITLPPVIDEEIWTQNEVPQSEQTPYGITMVQANLLHDIQVVEKKTVCVVDTGYGLGHPDLPDATHGVDGFSPYLNPSTSGVSKMQQKHLSNLLVITSLLHTMNVFTFFSRYTNTIF